MRLHGANTHRGSNELCFFKVPAAAGELRDHPKHWFRYEPFSRPEEERSMTTPDEMPVTGLTATETHELVAAGRGVLVDTRDRRLFDNAHAAGALSLPLTILEAGQGRAPVGVLPPDRTIILYCA